MTEWSRSLALATCLAGVFLGSVANADPLKGTKPPDTKPSSGSDHRSDVSQSPTRKPRLPLRRRPVRAAGYAKCDCTQPVVVERGDFLTKLADAFAFDPEAVWNDDHNADLRALRYSPDMLVPGDVMFIPGRSNTPIDAAPHAANGTSADPSRVPTSSISVRFTDAMYSSKAYRVEELDELGVLMTDETGTAKFDCPVPLQTITIVFSKSGESHQLNIGGMDPVDTLVGVFKRLQNLAYLSPDLDFDPNELDVLRMGLRALEAHEAPEAAESWSVDAGLGDDGTLNEDVKTMLVTAHGS